MCCFRSWMLTGIIAPDISVWISWWSNIRSHSKLIRSAMPCLNAVQCVLIYKQFEILLWIKHELLKSLVYISTVEIWYIIWCPWIKEYGEDNACVFTLNIFYTVFSLLFIRIMITFLSLWISFMSLPTKFKYEFKYW